MQRLQHIGACDARAKKRVALNLADVGDLGAELALRPSLFLATKGRVRA